MFNKLKSMHNNSIMKLSFSFLMLVIICLKFSSIGLDIFYEMLPPESIESFKTQYVQNVLIFGFIGVISTLLVLSFLLKYIVISNKNEKEENKDSVSDKTEIKNLESPIMSPSLSDKSPTFDDCPTKLELFGVFLFLATVLLFILNNM